MSGAYTYIGQLNMETQPSSASLLSGVSMSSVVALSAAL